MEGMDVRLLLVLVRLPRQLICLDADELVWRNFHLLKETCSPV